MTFLMSESGTAIERMIPLNVYLNECGTILLLPRYIPEDATASSSQFRRV